MCIILAGPTCGRTLAEYGADVIKIDPEHRPPTLTPWLDVGRGKRSICLNITRPGGLDAFDRLVDTADVVMEGFRRGVAERLGVGYERLRDRNPGIVYVSINAFGQEGPWSRGPASTRTLRPPQECRRATVAATVLRRRLRTRSTTTAPG